MDKISDSTIPFRRPWMNLDSVDSLLDDYGPATHTCGYCDKDFPALSDASRLVLDLSSCREAKVAAKAGCHFFQRIFHGDSPINEDARVCIDMEEATDELRIMKHIELRAWVRFWEMGSTKASEGESSLLKIWNREGRIEEEDLVHDEEIDSVLIRDKRRFTGYANMYLQAYLIEDERHKGPLLSDRLQPRNLNPISENAILRMRQWLKTCQEQHKHDVERAMLRRELGSQKQATSTPKRLIKIDPNFGTMKLVLGVQDMKYALLSYCWGGEQSFKTTKSNREQYEDSIPLSALSQSVQDAIKVATLLDLKYLWVDALCITQDDDLERRSEIERMADIYRGGVVTILAGGASKSSQGFLVPRTLVGDQYQISCKVGGARRKYLLQDQIVASLPETVDPVNYRGWIYQESILSPRLLYFSPQQIVMRCYQSRPSYYLDGGSGDMGITHELPYFNWIPYKDDQIRKLRDPSLISNKLLDKSFDFWTYIVRHYSTRVLAKPYDKLLALSAAAQVFSEVFMPFVEPPKYIAGLWKNHLPFNLLWRNETPSMRPKYRAPSWSWASVNGRISGPATLWIRAVHECCISVTDWDCHVDLENLELPFGHVAGGHLHLKGLMKEIPEYWFENSHIVFPSPPDWSDNEEKCSGFMDSYEFEATVPHSIKDRSSVFILSILRWPENEEEIQRTGEDLDNDRTRLDENDMNASEYSKDRKENGDDKEDDGHNIEIDSGEEEAVEFLDYNFHEFFAFAGLILRKLDNGTYSRIGCVQWIKTPLRRKGLRDWQKTFQWQEIIIV